jgi:hypothetical protein
MILGGPRPTFRPHAAIGKTLLLLVSSNAAGSLIGVIGDVFRIVLFDLLDAGVVQVGQVSGVAGLIW